MKYGLGVKFLISFLIGGVAVLYKFRLNPQGNQSEYSTIVNIPRLFLFNVLTETKNVPTYFSWISRLNELDPRKNLTLGKRYKGIVNMPFLGQHEITYKISEFKEGQWIIIKPDDIRGSYLNTEIILMINSITQMETQLYFKVTYHRTSALFQLTVGPFLKWLTDQQLRKAAFSARALGMSKWIQWQSTSSPPPVTKSQAPQKYHTAGEINELIPKMIKE